MKKSPEIDIAITALTFIKNNGAPVFVNDFINRDLTGDEMADSLLKKIALMMLDFMKKDGMIEADDLTCVFRSKVAPNSSRMLPPIPF